MRARRNCWVGQKPLRLEWRDAQKAQVLAPACTRTRPSTCGCSSSTGRSRALSTAHGASRPRSRQLQTASQEERGEWDRRGDDSVSGDSCSTAVNSKFYATPPAALPDKNYGGIGPLLRSLGRAARWPARGGKPEMTISPDSQSGPRGAAPWPPPICLPPDLFRGAVARRRRAESGRTRRSMTASFWRRVVGAHFVDAFLMLAINVALRCTIAAVPGPGDVRPAGCCWAPLPA